MKSKVDHESFPDDVQPVPLPLSLTGSVVFDTHVVFSFPLRSKTTTTVPIFSVERCRKRYEYRVRDDLSFTITTEVTQNDLRFLLLLTFILS